MVENKHKGNNVVGKGGKIMTLNEELDKIIDNVEVDNKKFKSELLALFERKLNEVCRQCRIQKELKRIKETKNDRT